MDIQIALWIVLFDSFYQIPFLHIYCLPFSTYTKSHNFFFPWELLMFHQDLIDWSIMFHQHLIDWSIMFHQHLMINWSIMFQDFIDWSIMFHQDMIDWLIDWLIQKDLLHKISCSIKWEIYLIVPYFVWASILMTFTISSNNIVVCKNIPT